MGLGSGVLHNGLLWEGLGLGVGGVGGGKGGQRRGLWVLVVLMGGLGGYLLGL